MIAIFKCTGWTFYCKSFEYDRGLLCIPFC